MCIAYLAYIMCQVPVIGITEYSDVAISRYRRRLCHDIVIHKKSTIRALLACIKNSVTSTNLGFFEGRCIFLGFAKTLDEGHRLTF